MRVRKSAATRKAEIIDATLRLADKVGPDRLTMDAVAGAVGLSQPGVFRHFPTKQELWNAVAERIGKTMEERWNRVRETDGSATSRIEAIVHAQLRLIDSTPAIPAILFSRELHAENDSLRKVFFVLMSHFHRRISKLVGEARDAGELRGDVEPDDVGFLIIGLVQGLAVRWSIGGRSFSLADEGMHLLGVQLKLLEASTTIEANCG